VNRLTFTDKDVVRRSARHLSPALGLMVGAGAGHGSRRTRYSPRGGRMQWRRLRQWPPRQPGVTTTASARRLVRPVLRVETWARSGAGGPASACAVGLRSPREAGAPSPGRVIKSMSIVTATSRVAMARRCPNRFAALLNHKITPRVATAGVMVRWFYSWLGRPQSCTLSSVRIFGCTGSVPRKVIMYPGG
jgi:hypothetical protein